MKAYTPYQERIRKCFADAYIFLDKHKHPRTEHDWIAIVNELEQYTDPLTSDLIQAALNEFEREYHENTKGEPSYTK